jgi:hypothetical protein
MNNRLFTGGSYCSCVERATRIELAFRGWQAEARLLLLEGVNADHPLESIARQAILSRIRILTAHLERVI